MAVTPRADAAAGFRAAWGRLARWNRRRESNVTVCCIVVLPKTHRSATARAPGRDLVHPFADLDDVRDDGVVQHAKAAERSELIVASPRAWHR
jgi:hypothetical protein